MTFSFHEPDFKSALWIASQLRDDDARELKAAMNGASPLEAVFISLAVSTWAEVVLYNGEPHSIWGYREDEMGGAIVWMVGTPLIERTPIATYKASKELVEELRKRYVVLYNRVDTRNELHIKWLKSLGFTFGDSEVVNGVEFKYFSMIGEGEYNV